MCNFFCYISAVLQEFVNVKGQSLIDHVSCRSRNSKGNGAAERIIQTFIRSAEPYLSGLKDAVCEDNADLDERLLQAIANHVIHSYNNTSKYFIYNISCLAHFLILFKI